MGILCGAGRFFAAAATLSSGAAFAAETTAYTYDELGRLIATSISGGPDSGRQSSTVYDPAGNRANHSIGPAGSPPPNAAVFSVSGPVPIDEGQSAVFTVTKSGTSNSTLSVNFATVNGSATAPSDYSAASGALSFRSWETVKTVRVATVADGVSEPTEQFSLQLSAPSTGASIGTGSATATINGSAPANQPPVTAIDYATVGICRGVTVNVIANDSDPEGNTPLVVLSATHNGGMGTASVVSSSQVRFLAFGDVGSAGVTYTVRDSLGATATGLLEVTIINGTGCM